MHACRIAILASDDLGWPAVRQALTAMADVQIAFMTTCPHEMGEWAPSANPDAIITARQVEDELMMPLLRRLRPVLPDTVFIVIAHDYDSTELLALDEVGIAGYLLWKDLYGERLRRYLSAAVGGEVAIVSGAVAGAYIVAQRQRLRQTDAFATSERERAVLRGLTEGLTQEAIASQLRVHPRTVEAAVAHLKRRLGATSEFTLAAQAVRHGLIN